MPMGTNLGVGTFYHTKWTHTKWFPTVVQIFQKYLDLPEKSELPWGPTRSRLEIGPEAGDRAIGLRLGL